MLRSGVGRYTEFGHDCRLSMRIFDRNVARRNHSARRPNAHRDDRLSTANCKLRLLITSGRRWIPQSIFRGHALGFTKLSYLHLHCITLGCDNSPNTRDSQQ
ncbi:hypothetical protein CEP54_013460 [Fusarium duplospermum]|uniref:Uncharacterized protein n=1 Tax=Fusarium duplospermum TaxID=1325734 RepID=A0A428P2U1_9HYPO|nr:hypothetical protein CEP54_013460 [Fusarium duplospermum]